MGRNESGRPPTVWVTRVAPRLWRYEFVLKGETIWGTGFHNRERAREVGTQIRDQRMTALPGTDSTKEGS